VPVRLAERGGDLRLRVLCVVDVVLEVAADGDGAERHVRKVHERLARQVRLRDRVVLELEVRSELHQAWPVGTGTRAHRVGSSSAAPISSLDQEPSRRRTPRSPPAGMTTKLAASSSWWYRCSPLASERPKRRRNRPSASGSSGTSKRRRHSPLPSKPSAAVSCAPAASRRFDSSRSSKRRRGGATGRSAVRRS